MAETPGASCPLPRAIIVAGPTASGKSALALALAQRLGGVVINADAMQIYRELRVLTARPSPEQEAMAPHVLYGVRPAAQPGSVAWWRDQARAAMAQAHRQGRVPILCGGTGMYLRALTHGLADLPDPGDAARQEAREALAELGAPALHARLRVVDPATAARLRPTDGQRLARAWEVWAGTGRGLTAWQDAVPATPAGWRFAAIILDPPRDTLRSAIAARFAAMLDAGALEEMRALLALRLDPALPAMRALGVAELAAHLCGDIALAEAQRRVILKTGQYTKRQATWFRHHGMAASTDTHMIRASMADFWQYSESLEPLLLNFLRNTG